MPQLSPLESELLSLTQSLCVFDEYQHQYRLTPATLTSLKSLEYLMKRDHPTLQPTYLQLGYWNTLHTQLLPILTLCHTQPVQDLQLHDITYTLLKLLTRMTMPIASNTEHYNTRIQHLQQYKAWMCEGDTLTILNILLVPLLGKHTNTRTEEEHNTLELILTLIKNLLLIPDHTVSVAASGANTAIQQTSTPSLDAKLLQRYRDEYILETLISLGENIQQEEKFSLLLLECVANIVKNEQPDNIMKVAQHRDNNNNNHIRPNNKSNHRISAVPPPPSSSLSLSRHLSNKSSLSLYRPIVPASSARHSRFGTVIAMKSVFQPKATTIIRNLDHRDHLPTDNLRSFTGRKPIKSISNQASSSSSLVSLPLTTPTASTNTAPILYDFILWFITRGCYTALMTLIIKELQENIRIVKEDEKNWMMVCSCFTGCWRIHQIQLIRKKQQHMQNTHTDNNNHHNSNTQKYMDIAPINYTLSLTCFGILHQKLLAYTQEKPIAITFLSAALLYYREIIHTLSSLLQYSDEAGRAEADALRRSFYYEKEQLDLLSSLLKSWHAHAQPIQVLTILVECVHWSMQVLDEMNEKHMILERRKRVVRKKKEIVTVQVDGEEKEMQFHELGEVLQARVVNQMGTIIKHKKKKHTETTETTATEPTHKDTTITAIAVQVDATATRVTPDTNIQQAAPEQETSVVPDALPNSGEAPAHSSESQPQPPLAQESVDSPAAAAVLDEQNTQVLDTHIYVPDSLEPNQVDSGPNLPASLDLSLASDVPMVIPSSLASELPLEFSSQSSVDSLDPINTDHLNSCSRSSALPIDTDLAASTIAERHITLAIVEAAFVPDSLAVNNIDIAVDTAQTTAALPDSLVVNNIDTNAPTATKEDTEPQPTPNNVNTSDSMEAIATTEQPVSTAGGQSPAADAADANGQQPETEYEEVLVEVDESGYIRKEAAFNFARYVLSFAHPIILSHYISLLEQYRTNSQSLNHMIISLFERIAFDQQLLPMFYQLSLFTLFDALLHDTYIAYEEHYSSVRDFAVKVIRGFCDDARENPVWFAECLFWKSITMVELIRNGYVDVKRERELLQQEREQEEQEIQEEAELAVEEQREAEEEEGEEAADRPHRDRHASSHADSSSEIVADEDHHHRQSKVTGDDDPDGEWKPGDSDAIIPSAAPRRKKKNKPQSHGDTADTTSAGSDGPSPPLSPAPADDESDSDIDIDILMNETLRREHERLRREAKEEKRRLAELKEREEERERRRKLQEDDDEEVELELGEYQPPPPEEEEDDNDTATTTTTMMTDEQAAEDTGQDGVKWAMDDLGVLRRNYATFSTLTSRFSLLSQLLDNKYTEQQVKSKCHRMGLEPDARIENPTTPRSSKQRKEPRLAAAPTTDDITSDSMQTEENNVSPVSTTKEKKRKERSEKKKQEVKKSKTSHQYPTRHQSNDHEDGEEAGSGTSVPETDAAEEPDEADAADVTTSNTPSHHRRLQKMNIDQDSQEERDADKENRVQQVQAQTHPETISTHSIHETHLATHRRRKVLIEDDEEEESNEQQEQTEEVQHREEIPAISQLPNVFLAEAVAAQPMVHANGDAARSMETAE